MEMEYDVQDSTPWRTLGEVSSNFLQILKTPPNSSRQKGDM